MWWYGFAHLCWCRILQSCDKGNFDLLLHWYMSLTFCPISRNNCFKEKLSVVASKYNLCESEKSLKQPKTWFYERSLLEVVFVIGKIWSAIFSKSSSLLDFIIDKVYQKSSLFTLKFWKVFSNYFNILWNFNTKQLSSDWLDHCLKNVQKSTFEIIRYDLPRKCLW